MRDKVDNAPTSQDRPDFDRPPRHLPKTARVVVRSSEGVVAAVESVGGSLNEVDVTNEGLVAAFNSVVVFSNKVATLDLVIISMSEVAVADEGVFYPKQCC